MYNNGTVCDDGFSDNSADAICRQMGYYLGATEWDNGNFYNFQSSLNITLDDVVCSSGSWDSCSYSTDENCGHSEDVHLACAVDGKYFEY